MRLKEEYGYVFVINKNSPIFIRHIITCPKPYEEKYFKEWYYSEYLDIDGDEFIYCDNKEEYDETYEKIRQEEKEWKI